MTAAQTDGINLTSDRHLNNIAVLEQNDRYTFCPIFDNGAGLLSNTQLSPMDIAPRALLASLRARPFQTTFTRQMNTARSLYGSQLCMPRLTASEVHDTVQPMLTYYAERDRDLIADRVTECILLRQKAM